MVRRTAIAIFFPPRPGIGGNFVGNPWLFDFFGRDRDIFLVRKGRIFTPIGFGLDDQFGISGPGRFFAEAGSLEGYDIRPPPHKRIQAPPGIRIPARFAEQPGQVKCISGPANRTLLNGLGRSMTPDGKHFAW